MQNSGKIKSIYYGQNFLKNPGLVRLLLSRTSISKNDTVYEIGGGKGVITTELAQIAGTVLVTEADQELFQSLQQKFKNQKNVEIYQKNALTYPLPEGKFKVFANIPFRITSDIIRYLLDNTNAPVDTYLILQKESAIKFCGYPSGKETQFSLLHKTQFDLSIIYQFKKTDFYPSPRVDSVLLHIHKKEKSDISSKHKFLFYDFITFAYNQRVPSLQKGLREIFTQNQFTRLASDNKFSQKAVPTDLNYQQWLNLFSFFLTLDITKQARVSGAYLKQQQSQNKILKIHRTRV